MRSHLRRPGARDARRTAASATLNAQRSHGREAANVPLPQQRLGNRAMQRMLYSGVSEPGGGAAESTFKTKATSGGLSGLTLNVTFSVSGTPADSLQAVQTFMGTRRSDGVQVGTYSWQWKGKTWDAFVDGGKNSPYVTLGGNPPAHATKPYYLTPTEVAAQVNFTKDTGTINVFDRPGAVAMHEEAHFETAIVAVNYNGTKQDKVLKVFKWGWLNMGTDPTVGKYWPNSEIAGAKSGISVMGAVSPEFANIVKHDYPKYRYS